MLFRSVTLGGVRDDWRGEEIIPVGQITADRGKVLLRDREGLQRDISQDGYEHIF